MRLPIRNRTATPLTLFVEPYCDQYEIPPGGEAIVTLGDGEAHSLDFHSENWIALWDEGDTCVVVEIVSREQNAVVEALAFVTTWLHQFGPEGRAAAAAMDEAVRREEEAGGYVRARFAAYAAFRQGYRMKAAESWPLNARLPPWPGRETLAGAYRAGAVAALFNHRVRLRPGLIELGKPPFDTDVARRIFEEADRMIG